MIRANSSRIWDVGEMEYPLIRTFLDELPMDQLSEVESSSPVRAAYPLEQGRRLMGTAYSQGNGLVVGNVPPPGLPAVP